MERITCTAFMLLIQTFQCLASDDSPFQLTNKATGFCLVKTNNHCNDLRWTTGDRLLVQQRNKCLGTQGKSVGSEISLYDCDETSELQKWECRNETVLALKGQELYINLTADNTAVLSKTTGPNNHLTISGTSSGACTRTYRELFALGGNAAGKTCMFPFLYKDQWYSNCTTFDSSEKRLWCAVETKYESERWGYCPTTSKEHWNVNPITNVYYQLNTQAALTWPQAEISCKQQGASLLSVNDPHEHAYITALLGRGGNTLWIGLFLDSEHGWKWSSGRPYRYLNWDSGHPLPNPGHNCAVVDPSVQYSWQSSSCSRKLGYICSSNGAEETPTQTPWTGFCPSPWIPYNGHCFHLNRTEKTWSDAQKGCRGVGGDLVSIRNVEDQSFVISQLGYGSTDELWIGLNDKKTERLFEWSDHSIVSYTSWEYGKPTVLGDIKDCVLIRGENGNWADRVCEEKHGFICMTTSVSTPTGDEVDQDVGCKKGWRRHGSYCYFIGKQTKTFDEAKDDCKSSDSYLADVSTGVDNAFLVSLVGSRPEKHFWLGLSNQDNAEKFVWTNTETVRFTHWNAQMPGHTQGCVAMKTGVFAGLWDVLPCTNREKYICKHRADGATVTPAPPTVNPPDCPLGWTPLRSRNQCYKLFGEYSETKRTWYEARNYCRAIGGDLLSIHSDAEQQVLPERYEVVWIGLSAPDPNAGYVWSDESPLNFQHWEEGEPNNKNNVESCAQIKLHRGSQSGSWNDVHCETFLGWLCQIRLGVTPSPSPSPVTPDYNRTSDWWLEWKGNQYYFNRDSMSMEEARHFCQQRHGDLATINSEAESVFIWKQISEDYGQYWIGLIVDLDGSFAWMDDSPVEFERWNENQPDFKNNDENCVAITSSMGFWHDYNCGLDYRSICKRSGSPPANATVAPTVPPKGGCPQSWKKINSKCYSIINNEKETWEGARTKCKSMGGNLASITTRHVQVFLTNKMVEAPTTNLWIGLHNTHDSSYYWTDGQPRRYNNWGFERYTSHIIYGDTQWRHPYGPQMTDDLMSYPHLLHLNEEGTCVAMTTDPKIGTGKWIKRSCNDTNGYVCMRNVDETFPDSSDPTPTGYVSIFNDSIKVVTQQMNWYAAQKNCEYDGANLASLRTEGAQVYVELMALDLKAPMWIGLNRNMTGGYFRYVAGWSMTISNWDIFEPRMGNPCVYVDEDGKWKTADCSQNMTSVCMKSADVPPTQSTEFPGICPEDTESPRYAIQENSWIPFRGYCYLFITQRIEWPDASASCARHGGTLASIETPEEQNFIESNVNMYKDSQPTFWIGLYKTHKGSWKWLDKTVMDYNNWGPGQPDSNYGTYAAITTLDGRWRIGNRWHDRGYICKTHKVLKQIPPKPGVSKEDSQTRGHIILAVVLVIAVIAIGTVTVLFFLKKSGVRIAIPEKLTTFDNPLFFSNERHQAGQVDTNKLVGNAEEDDSGTVRTV
ncbi:macrophage mannose receptor 1-like [Mugil cephalus]|uniref:macrophage mannose receptor 1-like n=1 Tax=Mugil cephalus TaxID=48193 RepID=UPI001FB5AD0D|nr:macrophage mannose receptor 1-like [Mugil cephalus]